MHQHSRLLAEPSIPLALVCRKKCQQLEEKISVLQQDLTCLNKSALRIYEVVVGEGQVSHNASPTSKQAMTADMVEAVVATVLEGSSSVSLPWTHSKPSDSSCDFY